MMLLEYDVYYFGLFGTWRFRYIRAYLVLTLCGLALRSTRMTRPRVQRTSP